MSLRNPIAIRSITDTGTSGAVNYDFLLPQDLDQVTFRLTAGTFTGTNPTCDVYIQTSPDGGTTWYDVCNLGQITAAVTAQNARFAFASASGHIKRTQGASVLDIGAAAASTTSSSAYTGVPLLGQAMRITFKYGGTQLANAGVRVDLYGNQSPRA